MKILVLIINSLILFLIIALACQKAVDYNPIIHQADDIIMSYSDDSNFDCSFVEDAIIYPEPWTNEVANMFTIAKDELKSISTCGLIQTFFNQPWNILGPWCTICSDYSIDGVQYFNDRVIKDAILTELFSREDALNKLIGKYIGFIQDIETAEKHQGLLNSYEILLSSELLNEILVDSVADELMVLALKMIAVKKENSLFKADNSLAITRHILTNILLQKRYEPFLTDCLVDSALETSISGYKVCYDSDRVENYAKKYLTEEK